MMANQYADNVDDGEYDEITDSRWRNGLTYGLVLAIVGVVSNLIASRLLNVFPGSAPVDATTNGAFAAYAGLGCLSFLIQLAIFFVAGLMTAHRSGTVGSASHAGLLAGLIGSFFSSVMTLVVFYLFIMPQLRLPYGSTYTLAELQSGLAFDLIIYGLITVVVGAAIGAGVAAIGGVIGRAWFNAEADEEEAAERQAMQQYFDPRFSAAPGGMYPGQPGANPPQYTAQQYNAPPFDQPPPPPWFPQS